MGALKPACESSPQQGPCEFNRLVAQAVSGEPLAWKNLVTLLHPSLLDICRRRALGMTEDDQREVTVLTLERLRARDFCALRRYLTASQAHHSAGTAGFIRWLAAVAHNTYIDYLRGLPEFQRKRSPQGRMLTQVEVVSLGVVAEPHAPGRDAATNAELTRILRCLEQEDFSPSQRQALKLWMLGFNATEVAAELQLAGPAEARRLLHTARQRLRRRVVSLRPHGGGE